MSMIAEDPSPLLGNIGAQDIANATNLSSHIPSAFGALPYPGTTALVDPPLQTIATFRFASVAQPDMLNCTVIGPGGETCYHIATDASEQGCTLLRAAAGQTVAIVEWRSHPVVEAYGAGPKQFVGEWLKLSPDRSSRTMMYGGLYYSWAPVNRFLHLFVPGSSEWLARVTRRYDAVVLELSTSAIELGLTHVAVLGAVLLQCGKRID